MKGTKVAEHLDQHLANLHVLYTKLHTITGMLRAAFFVIHSKLEELYDAVAEKLTKWRSAF